MENKKKYQSRCRINLIYNTRKDFSTNISNFLLKCNNNIRKTQLNTIPNIVLGMILSESCVSSNIAKELNTSNYY